jgi:hypothetical protein
MNKIPDKILFIVISPKVAVAPVFLFDCFPSIGFAFRWQMCACPHYGPDGVRLP